MKKYYKCDICNKATEKVAIIKTKGTWLFDNLLWLGDSGFMLCPDCYKRVVEKVRKEKGLIPSPPKSFKPAGHEVETR